MNKKLVEHRIKSNNEYVDKLQDRYSKINVIRIDLSYTKDSKEDITLEDANKHINTLLNNRRSKPTIFEHNIGYIIKRECGAMKDNVHLHTMFIFDGQKVRQDITKANQIGEYWKNEITKGKGIYHNCHKNNYEDNGIGMINHDDTQKRKNLNRAIEYLCKEEQFIDELKTNKKDKAMTRGTLAKKNNRGRPRKKVSD